MERINYKFEQQWHIAINEYAHQHSGTDQWPSVMYDAKAMADEVPRMTLLFEMERNDKLPKIHRQCSHDEGEPVIDNHLSCCLGVECRKCPMLLALDKARLQPEEIDQAKAWTCAAHIMSELGKTNRGFDTSEGWILTTDDRMYWQRLYSSLAGMTDGDPDDEDFDDDEDDSFEVSPDQPSLF